MAAATSEYDIFGAGNALLDISCEVPEEFLTKYEIQQGNAILAEEKHLPMYAEMCAMDSVQYIPGGSTLNSVRVAQWVLNNMAGAESSTAYISSINGGDNYGQTMKEALTSEGVSAAFYEGSEKATGTCAVAVPPSKDRSLVANLAAANDYVKDHLDSEEAKNLWQNAKVGYISGFWLTVCPEGMEDIAKYYKEQGRPFGVNTSAPFICQFFVEKLKAVLADASYLFGNNEEMTFLSASLNYGTDDLNTIAQNLVRDYDLTVVMTCGKDPVIVCTTDGTITTYDVALIDASAIVDLNGAGDAFVGGYLSGLAQGLEQGSCVSLGNYCAGTIIQRSGCDLNVEFNHTI